METTDAQKSREKFLASRGINAKDQALAVYTIRQIQDAIVTKVDETSIIYLRRWEKELPENPKNFMKWMKEHDATFYAAGKSQEPLTGWHSLTYVYGRKPDVKRAYEVRFRVQPILNTGNVRLDFEHQEIVVPPELGLSLK